MKAYTPEEQARLDSQKDAKGNIRKSASLRDVAKKQAIGLALNQGSKLAGQGISSAINPTITVTGTLPNGNFQLSDGGVTTPSGEVVTEGSTAKEGGSYGTAILGAVNLFRALSDKNASGADKAVGGLSAGTQIASAVPGLEALGPIGTGIGTAYGGYKVLSSDASGEQKAAGLRRIGEDTGLAISTSGISPLVQLADQKLLGGKINNVRNKYDKAMDSPLGAAINPVGFATNKILGKGLGMIGGSGKSGDQQQRDAYRKAFAQQGLIKGGDDYNVNFSDGTKFDIGLDGGAKLTNDAGESRGYNDVDLNDKRTGVAIANLAPLTSILTGGNKERAQDFTGYFTNAVLNGGADDATRLKRTRELYDQSKVTRDIALQKINEMEKAGQLDAGTAAVNRANLDQVFGAQAQATQAPQTQQQAPQQRAPEKKTPVKKPTLKDVAPKSPAEILPQMSAPPPVIEPDDTPDPEEEQDVFNYKKMLESFAQRNNGL